MAFLPLSGIAAIGAFVLGRRFPARRHDEVEGAQREELRQHRARLASCHRDPEVVDLMMLRVIADRKRRRFSAPGA